MNRRYLITLLLIVCVLFTGCTTQPLENPEQILKLIDDAVKITEKAANEKDLKLAREVWTQVSEYGVKAKELGNKELADSLGKLASTYVYLVSYIESGDTLQLTNFRNCFDQAVNQLRKFVSNQQSLKMDKR